MRVRVVVPPAPIVSPSDIAGDHDANDARVELMIAAATEVIDGPDGWLGRALGPQTIELSSDCWRDRSFRLPCPPVIEMVSVQYRDGDGALQTVDPASYTLADELLWFRPNWSAPSLGCFADAVRIRYRAGYVKPDGSPNIPARVKQAIIISVQDQLRMTANEPVLRSENVEGVGSQSFVDGDKISALMQAASERLLEGLRVYSL